MRPRPLLPALGLLAGLSLAPPVEAGGIPTVDAISNANLVALLTEAQSTLLQLEKQYEAISELRGEIAGLAPLIADLEKIASGIAALDAGNFTGAGDLAARLAAITAPSLVFDDSAEPDEDAL